MYLSLALGPGSDMLRAMLKVNLRSNEELHIWGLKKLLSSSGSFTVTIKLAQ